MAPLTTVVVQKKHKDLLDRLVSCFFSPLIDFMFSLSFLSYNLLSNKMSNPPFDRGGKRYGLLLKLKRRIYLILKFTLGNMTARKASMDHRRPRGTSDS